MEAVILTIPIIMYIWKKPANGSAFFYSIAIGITLLTSNMVYNEFVAKDSDTDAIFFFSIIIWNGILCIIYSIEQLLLSVIERIMRFCLKH